VSLRSTGRTRSTNGRTYKRRYARNRRRFNYRKLIKPLLSLVILAAIGTGCYYLFTTPELQITQVKVQGTRLLDASEIKVQVGSAVVGKNILIIPKKQIIGQVVKNRPEIESIKIGRVLPETVIVKIQERRPDIVLSIPKGVTTNGQMFDYWLVDKDGVIFHKVDRPWKSLTLIELPAESKKSMVLGKKARGLAYNNAIQCLKICRKTDYKIDKISVDPVGNLCLNIGSDFYVKLGQPVEIPEKLATLSEKILPALLEKGEQVLYIDITCYEKPAWKPKPVEGEQPSRDT
jgi:hypothetical protein